MLTALNVALGLVLVASCLGQVRQFKDECVTGKYPPSSSRKVPNGVVNLDLPPETRWVDVVRDKGPQIKTLIGAFKEFILAFGKGSAIVVKFVDDDLGYLVDTFPSPFDDEIKGIANATGIPLGEVVLYNVFYEIFTVCTSIVAQNDKGKMYHARNLDFGLFMGWDIKNHTWAVTEALRPLIMNLDFQHGGKTVFKSVNFAGYVGILTAIKPGVFTMTMDERFNKDGGYIGILKWILGDRSGRWMGFLTREVMEYATSYEQAKSKLANTPMLAPAYFIMGGNKSGQACVITRARSGPVDMWNMNTTDGMWYLVETNYDHWKKPLFLDDRRTPAKKCMKQLTSKGVSIGGLFNVLSSRPVLNKLTTYSALMQVNDGTLETYLQSCPDPCFPW